MFARFSTWCKERKVVDEWLIDACLRTMAAWDREPDGPNARLAEDFPWYSCGVLPEVTVPHFAPTLEKPYPTYKASADTGLWDGEPETLVRALYQTPGDKLLGLVQSVEVETLEDFENRMRSQFERQLRMYLKLIRESFDYGSRMSLFDHAEWTALRFGGLTLSVIADALSRESKNRDGITVDTVAKAVKRFAGRIGLTLP